MIIGLGLRFIVALIYPYAVHPDEVFQYYEQAHRLVYGYGFVPWEYVYGIRSWAIPLALAGILEVARIVGWDTPAEYMTVVSFSLCLLSITLPLGMYRLGQRVLDERGAIYAFLFGVFWWHFLYFAHKPMPGILATYALIWGCVLLYRPATRTNLLLLGLLAASVIVLRYQIVPAVGVIGLLAIMRLEWKVWPALLSFGIVVLIAGLLDLWTWNGFLFSFFENFRLNFTYDISSVFGINAWHYYLRKVIEQTLGLAVLAALGAVVLLPRLWPLFAAVAVGIAALHIPAHKEFRFVIWAFPIMFIALAGGLRFAFERSIIAARSERPALALVLVAGLFVMSWSVNQKNISSREQLSLRDTFTEISRDPQLAGVEVRIEEVRWWDTFGYYAMGQPVPIYFVDEDLNESVVDREKRLKQVSHIVISAGDEPPEGFELAFEMAGNQTWKSTNLKQKVELSDIEFILAPPTIKLADVKPKPPPFLLEASDRK